MTELDLHPSYNLWDEPWIPLVEQDGTLLRLGIRRTLIDAHTLRGIYEPSPLASIGVLRLLVAVLQDALAPQDANNLFALWVAGRFPEDCVEQFGCQFHDRFDLFSEDSPFLQSADLGLTPAKDDRVKSIGYLVPELPTGSEITHYRHGGVGEYMLCPACAARGLAMVPPFATSGGAGIKPSINGVPPIYVMPQGETLFASLAASLLCPPFQPKAASHGTDRAWWRRPPCVGRGEVTTDVGYLHSLTFAARRVRLHPELLNAACTRCGEVTEWGVRTMVYDMGESRPKGPPIWLDPFAAYHVSKKGDPVPLRPQEGKALWREYASLFLVASKDAGRLRPRVLDQLGQLHDLVEEGLVAEVPIVTYRCVGIRTDMKAKVFEWVDGVLDVPPILLRNSRGAIVVDEAIRYASDCAQAFRDVFRAAYARGSRGAERHMSLRLRSEGAYWATLVQPFRQLVLQVGPGEQIAEARLSWAERVGREAQACYQTVVEGAGDDAASLRRRYEGQMRLDARLGKLRKEYLGNDGA
ncbi:MAG: type I-E CRISPR-associated protein Cse1/CasA [Anaerolineae bacterium]